MSSSHLSAEVAATAARLIVEEGMEYGAAKRRAAKMLGQQGLHGAELPDNDAVEEEVRAYLQLFRADTQPAELRALREVAASWMKKLQDFRPHLTGAVWRGTATRLSNVHLQLFCNDSKEAELSLIDQHIAYEVGAADGPRGEPVDVLSVSSHSPSLGERVTVHLTILDLDDLRGALKPGARHLPERGDLVALQRLLEPA